MYEDGFFELSGCRYLYDSGDPGRVIGVSAPVGEVSGTISLAGFSDSGSAAFGAVECYASGRAILGC